MKVPYLDLELQHAPLRGQIHAALDEIMDGSSFVGGRQVADFEREFASYCGTREAVGVGSGTDALWLALMSIGVGPGDEVITSPMTFVATVEAILRVGATPVFVDICPLTYNLDPEQVDAALTDRCKAIVPVHLFGQTAELSVLNELASRHGVVMIEDAAQAHGAEYQGKRAGSWGRLGCFSFYPGKNLGAFGEAGAVTTDDEVLASRIRAFANHGQRRKHAHDLVGWNCRLDTLQAAILSLKLRGLDEVSSSRRRHAARYDRGFAGLEGMVSPFSGPDCLHVYHVYAIRVDCRDQFLEMLGERGVECGIHYPVPVHLQEAYTSLGYQRGSFPVAELCADEFLSLPMYAELTDVQVDYVVECVRELIACGVAA